MDWVFISDRYSFLLTELKQFISLCCSDENKPIIDRQTQLHTHTHTYIYIYTYIISGIQTHFSAYVEAIIRLHLLKKSLTALMLKYIKIYSSRVTRQHELMEQVRDLNFSIFLYISVLRLLSFCPLFYVCSLIMALL